MWCEACKRMINAHSICLQRNTLGCVVEQMIEAQYASEAGQRPGYEDDLMEEKGGDSPAE